MRLVGLRGCQVWRFKPRLAGFQRLGLYLLMVSRESVHRISLYNFYAPYNP